MFLKPKDVKQTNKYRKYRPEDIDHICWDSTNNENYNWSWGD